MDDGGDGVEEGQLRLAGEGAYGCGKPRRGEGACGDNHAFPVAWGRALNLFTSDLNQILSFQRRRHGLREALPVHRQRAACGHLMLVGAAHDERAHAPHLLMQQADRVAGGVVGAEGVGADELGELFALVGLGAANRAHLVQHDWDARARDLPGRFRARKAAADDVDGLVLV